MTQTELTQYIADHNMSSKSLGFVRNSEFGRVTSLSPDEQHFSQKLQTVDLRVSEQDNSPGSY